MLFYLPCHFDISKKNYSKISVFNINNKQIKILFPANPFRKEKNFKLFIKTKNELEKRGWQIEIKYLENISRKETIKKFKWADIILLTSKREGGPLVTKEAIFCGSRVVCTPVGDTIEWLPSNSISLSHNFFDLANCVENALMNSPNSWEIPKRFWKDSVLEKLESIYQTN